jgi:hypothetical protein
MKKDKGKITRVNGKAVMDPSESGTRPIGRGIRIWNRPKRGIFLLTIYRIFVTDAARSLTQNKESRLDITEISLQAI